MEIFISELADFDALKLKNEYFEKKISGANSRRVRELKTEAALIAYALKIGFNRAIDRLIITQSDEGKPFFVGENADLHFSVSHSGNLVAVGFSENEIGIDVQVERRVSETHLKKFGAEDADGFFEGFTRLESVGKLAGTGYFAAKKNPPEAYCHSEIIVHGGEKYYFCTACECGEEVNIRWVCSEALEDI